jgi:hypothetical protein
MSDTTAAVLLAMATLLALYYADAFEKRVHLLGIGIGPFAPFALPSGSLHVLRHLTEQLSHRKGWPKLDAPASTCRIDMFSTLSTLCRRQPRLVFSMI